MKIIYFLDRMIVFLSEEVMIRFSILPYIVLSKEDFNTVDEIFKKKHSGAFDCSFINLMSFQGTALFRAKVKEFYMSTEQFQTKTTCRSLSHSINLN